MIGPELSIGSAMKGSSHKVYEKSLAQEKFGPVEQAEKFRLSLIRFLQINFF